MNIPIEHVRAIEEAFHHGLDGTVGTLEGEPSLTRLLAVAVAVWTAPGAPTYRAESLDELRTMEALNAQLSRLRNTFWPTPGPITAVLHRGDDECARCGTYVEPGSGHYPFDTDHRYCAKCCHVIKQATIAAHREGDRS